jgi:hypothetical protein
LRDKYNVNSISFNLPAVKVIIKTWYITSISLSHILACSLAAVFLYFACFFLVSQAFAPVIEGTGAKVNDDYVDKFGTKKIYPTAENGREWYVNNGNPEADKLFDLGGATIESRGDSSWRIGSDDIEDGFNGQYHIIMSVNSPEGVEEWKNVEITGYVNVRETDDDSDSLQWYARGGRHGDDVPCEGTSLKGRLHADGRAGWIKEIWHDGGYTEENGTMTITHPITDRWVGWKVVMFNINNDSAVVMESYLDDNNDNNWKKVSDFVDNGGWYASATDEEFHHIECGKAKDYVITNSGPIVSFRSDGMVWDFKNLSVREIQP